MKRMRVHKSHSLCEFLTILVFICFLVTNGEASRIEVNAFGDSAVLIDFSELPKVHDYPSPITQYENVSEIGVTFYVISYTTDAAFRTSGFEGTGIGTNHEYENYVDAIEAVFSTPVLRAGAVISISKAMVSAYDENNNLLEQHYASTVNYDPLNHNNDIKEFVGIQNYAGIKKLVFEDVELNGRIMVLQDFIFESKPAPEIIALDIKPGGDPNSINPKSNGKIPIAILSTEEFDALQMVNKDSLTFGATGEEESLAFCNHRGEDVNGDGLKDLICHFFAEDTGFLCRDTEGVLIGMTTDGTPIVGKDSVRIVPCKK